jgi:hypothetical protein
MMHTVTNNALKTKVRLAMHTFALREAERAKNVVTLTPQFMDLQVCPRYPGEGEPLPHGDPLIPVTRFLPHLLCHLVHEKPTGSTYVLSRTYVSKSSMSSPK